MNSTALSGPAEGSMLRSDPKSGGQYPNSKIRYLDGFHSSHWVLSLYYSVKSTSDTPFDYITAT